MHPENTREQFEFLTNKKFSKGLCYVSLCVFLILIGMYSVFISEKTEGTIYMVFGLLASIFGVLASLLRHFLTRKKYGSLPEIYIIVIFLFEIDFFFASLLLLMQSAIIAIIPCVLFVVLIIFVACEHKEIVEPRPIFNSSGTTELNEREIVLND